jgi:hypothetical protein
MEHTDMYNKTERIFHGTKELLRMQSRGERLTPDEKRRVQKYADETRRKRQKS